MTTKTQTPRKIKTERYLRVTFTDEQLLEISKELSSTLGSRAAIESDKKRMGKEFDARLAEMDARIDIASEKVRSGYECRNVTCSVSLNDPKVGTKTITRDDSGEVVGVEMMTPNEMQEELPLVPAEPAPVARSVTPEPAPEVAPSTPTPDTALEIPDGVQEDEYRLLMTADFRSDGFRGALRIADRDTLTSAAARMRKNGKARKLIDERLSEMDDADEDDIKANPYRWTDDDTPEAGDPIRFYLNPAVGIEICLLAAERRGGGWASGLTVTDVQQDDDWRVLEDGDPGAGTLADALWEARTTALRYMQSRTDDDSKAVVQWFTDRADDMRAEMDSIVPTPGREILFF